jgi:hypothetical protein
MKRQESFGFESAGEKTIVARRPGNYLAKHRRFALAFIYIVYFRPNKGSLIVYPRQQSLI